MNWKKRLFMNFQKKKIKNVFLELLQRNLLYLEILLRMLDDLCPPIFGEMEFLFLQFYKMKRKHHKFINNSQPPPSRLCKSRKDRFSNHFSLNTNQIYKKLMVLCDLRAKIC